ncbi:MAG: hypothetical protein IJU48_07380 [Synergistaceae bacterium]|nr:hypothetical protein [Synergistaceae bacterium]
MRLARADIGTPVIEWLRMTLTDLFEWVNIVSDEAKRLEREMKKNQK